MKKQLLAAGVAAPAAFWVKAACASIPTAPTETATKAAVASVAPLILARLAFLSLVALMGLLVGSCNVWTLWRSFGAGSPLDANIS